MKTHAIEKQIHRADQAINNGDLDALTASYTTDAVLVVRPGLLASGHDDIRAAHKRIAAYFNHSLAVSQDKIHVIEAGDTALVMARANVQSPKKPDSAYSQERDAIYVYRRSDNGQWLCLIDNSYGFELLQE